MSNKGCFQKGSIPWNKGMKGYDAGGRARKTRFKPGSVPPNRRPVGSTRLTKEGYIEIKIEEGNRKWRLLHREVWKRHFGEYPAKDMVIVFKDGNRLNTDISNLELISRRELMDRNTVQNYPEEVKEVVRLRGVLTRKINDRQKHY